MGTESDNSLGLSDECMKRYVKELEKVAKGFDADAERLIALKNEAQRRFQDAKTTALAWRGYTDAAILKGNQNEAKIFMKNHLNACKDVLNCKDELTVVAANTDSLMKMVERLRKDLNEIRSVGCSNFSMPWISKVLSDIEQIHSINENTIIDTECSEFEPMDVEEALEKAKVRLGIVDASV